MKHQPVKTAVTQTRGKEMIDASFLRSQLLYSFIQITEVLFLLLHVRS
jgi:hypothetical protein